MSPDPSVEDDEQGVEILPPARSPDISMALVSSPDIGGALAEFRDRLRDVLEIPLEACPPGREIVLEVQIAVIPTSVKATVRNSSCH